MSLVAPEQAGTVCPYCRSAAGPGEALVSCAACHTVHHRDCWEEASGCAVYGCENVPPTDHLTELEIAPSYWGRDEKPCPACGEGILAAAVRCRHCGTEFDDAAPVTAEEFARTRQIQAKLPAKRVQVGFILAAAIVPFTAPLAAVVAGLWYLVNRKSFAQLPRVLPSLALIAFWVGVSQSAVAAAVWFLHSRT